MTKVCRKCSKLKDSSEFPKRSASKDGLHIYCKACVKKLRPTCYERDYYTKNREYLRKYAHDRYVLQRDAFYEHLRGIKASRGCERCGEKDPDVLRFHHKDPSTKKFTVSEMMRLSLSVVDTEVAKCSILCQNCHVRAERELRETVNVIQSNI